MRKLIFAIGLFFLTCFSGSWAQEETAVPQLQPIISKERQEEEAAEQELYAAIARLISNQIRPCWKIPAGSTDSLEAYIDIDPEGHLKFAGFSSELTPAHKRLANSIKDAIADPKCNPIKNLPPKELYYVWQKIALLFAPKK